MRWTEFLMKNNSKVSKECCCHLCLCQHSHVVVVMVSASKPLKKGVPYGLSPSWMGSGAFAKGLNGGESSLLQPSAFRRVRAQWSCPWMAQRSGCHATLLASISSAENWHAGALMVNFPTCESLRKMVLFLINYPDSTIFFIQQKMDYHRLE